MNRIIVPYRSFGTVYGTVHNYDTEGNNLGGLDITGYGLFLVVKNSNDPFGTTLVRKSVGTGATIPTGTLGLFTVTFQSTDLNFPPKEYFYSVWINPSGGTFSEGASIPMKCVGSGIFEISKTAWFGTL